MTFLDTSYQGVEPSCRLPYVQAPKKKSSLDKWYVRLRINSPIETANVVASVLLTIVLTEHFYLQCAFWHFFWRFYFCPLNLALEHHHVVIQGNAGSLILYHLGHQGKACWQHHLFNIVTRYTSAIKNSFFMTNALSFYT